MDLAAGERLITSDTEAVDNPKCSASVFSVLRRGATSVEMGLILDTHVKQLLPHSVTALRIRQEIRSFNQAATRGQ